MLTAGDHAKQDIGGDKETSWANLLKKEGFEVSTILKGLGSNNEFVKLYAKRIKQTADDHQIDLTEQTSSGHST